MVCSRLKCRRSWRWHRGLSTRSSTLSTTCSESTRHRRGSGTEGRLTVQTQRLLHHARESPIILGRQIRHDPKRYRINLPRAKGRCVGSDRGAADHEANRFYRSVLVFSVPAVKLTSISQAPTVPSDRIRFQCRCYLPSAYPIIRLQTGTRPQRVHYLLFVA